MLFFAMAHLVGSENAVHTIVPDLCDQLFGNYLLITLIWTSYGMKVSPPPHLSNPAPYWGAILAPVFSQYIPKT